jgi:UDP-N-acetylmuramoylalanine--D-glutamate ligase
MRRRPALPEGPYLVVGLARSGVAAALALRRRGYAVSGTDAAEVPDAGLLADAGVNVLGADDAIAALAATQTVIKSPGVPAGAPVIVAARAQQMQVMGELELGWRMLANELIAVTGTNGKTTTVEWIAHLYRTARQPVAVAGNVGLALSALALGESGRTVGPDATIVCEASSFQLEDTSEFAPDAAVLLNLSPDHLDRHGSFDAYRAAKLNVFARQRDGDLAVIAAGVEVDLARLGSGALEVRFGSDSSAQLQLREGRIWWEGNIAGAAAPGQPLVAVTELSLRGSHNVCNAMAAAAVCLARGVDIDAVRAGLRDFAGVPHRLETVSRRGGVLYVNDSKATNVSSTLVALDALCAAGAGVRAPCIHLILGGQGKRQDFSPLREPVAECCRAVYLIGEDAEQIAEALDAEQPPLVRCGDLDHAAAAAAAAARPGEVVLLSPGCASFDQFADFEARGERFRELVS